MVGTMIWTNRVALGAGGRNGTDRVIHKRDEEPHRAGPWTTSTLRAHPPPRRSVCRARATVSL